VADSFRAKTVVITGAAGGIGTALCRRFAREDARVVAVDLDVDGLRRLRDEIAVQTIGLDLTDATETCRALGELQVVDVLVNNAGVTALGPADEIPLEVVERVTAVNFLGSVNAARAVLGSLVERRGRIGVLSSVAGFAPLLHRTAYSASKHALHGFFESLRVELAATGVSVTMVCPTFADTGMQTRAVARSEGKAGEWSTTGKHLTADQVAKRAISGLRARKRLVLPGATAKTAYWVSRLAPATFERLMRSRIS
jgi:short-subunit dehydrogenase